ncbi:hypothetical protein [Pseudoalteromonas sp. MMG007]|uniref:hypothetical protein n=1 Tax=Pseudoalteromonas sp. MMG007 TaxID=2822684 RepID=UPI001B3774AB|nr:hypothetical protein [Pseudoalteromonas sp. MMG007]MBQ4857750.1 hypothetical protein [Pseudoalteromonas sp. MMG007]
MFKVKAYILSITVCSVLISGCSSTPKSNASDMGIKIPSWVLNPTAESGLIASSCVVASNSFAMDKAEATMHARTELVNQLDSRIASLQEQYSEKTTNPDESVSQSKLLNTTTQFTEQALRSSKVIKVDYAQMGEQKNLCALVTVTEEAAQSLFKQVIKKAPVKLSPENETLLYLNFIKAENAQ